MPDLAAVKPRRRHRERNRGKQVLTLNKAWRSVQNNWLTSKAMELHKPYYPTRKHRKEHE